MVKKQKLKEIGFQLKGIELLESHLNTPLAKIDANTVFKFNINLEHKIDPGKNIILVLTTVDILIGEEREIVGSVKTNIIYEIENLAEYNSTKGFNLPTDFITSINSITLSTCRGIMYSQFKGTILHNTFLPIVDPKSFTQNPQI